MKWNKVTLAVMAVVMFVVLTSATDGGCTPNGLTYVQATDVKIKTDKEGYTAEQVNIKRRIELASDASAIWWIYCMTDMGQVVFYGAVKGKVTSSGKNVDGHTSESYIGWDGAYGSGDQYVYWFDPAGVYHQWNGKYFLTSKEIDVQSPVLNFRGVK